MKIGRWTVKQAPVEGFILVVPTTFLKATPEEIEEKTGGCGPGEIGDWFVPDSIYGESIHLACRIHDWMYGEGKTKEDKKWSDIVFLINMTLLIIGGSNLLDVLRLRRVMTYFEAVYFGGSDAFDKGETMKADINKKRGNPSGGE